MTKESDLKQVVISRLGHIAAISPESYQQALQDIAKKVGRVVDKEFKLEVLSILKDLPCPID